MKVEHTISSTKLHKKMMKMSTLELQHDYDFKKLLLEAVDEGLSSLGDSPKKAIYFHLERNFGIKKQDIPDRIEEFTEAIENIFGHGARILEICIMKHLYEKVGDDFLYVPETDVLLFTEYVMAASEAQSHSRLHFSRQEQP